MTDEKIEEIAATETPVQDDVDTDDADLATDEEIAASAGDQDDSDEQDNDDEHGNAPRGRGRLVKRVGSEVHRLMDLSVKYPEIGPTVADLAFKLGYADVGHRILRMGLESDGERNIDYFFVAAEAARREGRHDDVLTAVLDGVAAHTPEAGNTRVLHLIRQGFAVLMFDINDVKARPEFTAKAVEALKGMEAQFADDPFFYTLLAQGLWSTDRDASEAAWDTAVEKAEKETTWNARGTWYKEAEKHLGRAEEAYRRGLKDTPGSALLMHNLAQVLMDRAAATDTEPAKAHEWARSADRLMRKAIRASSNPRLKRHIRENIERVAKFRAQLPPEAEAKAEKTPEVGDVVHGKVRSIQVYGAFLSIPGGHSGLLHKTEMTHEAIDHPNQVLKVGDSLEVKIIEVKAEDNGSLRIGFSRKAVLPAPAEGAAPARPARQERSERKDQKGGERKGGNDRRTDNRSDNRNDKGGERKGGNDRRNDNRSDNRNDRKGGNDRRGGGAPREYRDPTPSSDDKFGKLGDILLAKLNLTRDDE